METSPIKTESDYADVMAERSRKIFVEALLNPPKPNDATIAAAKRFKQVVG
jgi:uncharacterized protein (DUF1778 family)